MHIIYGNFVMHLWHGIVNKMRPETKIKYKRAYNEAAVYADMEVDDDI